MRQTFFDTFCHPISCSEFEGRIYVKLKLWRVGPPAEAPSLQVCAIPEKASSINWMQPAAHTGALALPSVGKRAAD